MCKFFSVDENPSWFWSIFLDQKTWIRFLQKERILAKHIHPIFIFKVKKVIWWVLFNVEIVMWPVAKATSVVVVVDAVVLRRFHTTHLRIEHPPNAAANVKLPRIYYLVHIPSSGCNMLCSSCLHDANFFSVVTLIKLFLLCWQLMA